MSAMPIEVITLGSVSSLGTRRNQRKSSSTHFYARGDNRASGSQEVCMMAVLPDGLRFSLTRDGDNKTPILNRLCGVTAETEAA